MLETHPADLQDRLASLRPAFEAQLREIVEIPTVSVDPAHRADVRRGAEWAQRLLAEAGAEARIYETTGHPVVVGTFRHPQARRTLTIYNHLDVQPANEPEWQGSPFTFAVEGDVYRGRGTTDDKGPALAAFHAALLAQEAKLPLNLRFIWEFEEEIGSPHFEAFLEAHRTELATDSVLVSDTIWLNRAHPAAPAGLRGMLCLRLTLETGTKDVHSGLAGGAARNPLAELCQLVSELHDARTGEVKIPGFYDRVAPLSSAERASFEASGFDLGSFREAHGLKRLRTDVPIEVMTRIWAQPTFEVHGLVGGYTGPGVKAIVPPRAEAKVSMRLVPDMQPADVLELVSRFIRERHPDVQIEVDGMLEAYKGASTGPYADAVRAAMRFGFGGEPAFVREGGSIGAVVSMQRQLGCPVMFIGMSLPEHGYHAPNECFDWGMAAGGIKALRKYFELLP